MSEELKHELLRLTYSPEIVSFELTREQGLEILKEIERLNNIINEFDDFIINVDNHINLGDESEEFILVRDKWLELQELKGVDKE